MTISGITGPIQFTNLALIGSQFVLSGLGGPTNTSYVAVSSTNIATPISLWSPARTNFFNALGQFLSTNNVTAGAQGQFFRLRFP